jgi:selenocysteine lyase/cysteine desulfurase
MPEPFDISNARSRFPALQQDQVFLDNAGGSQALGTVIDSYVHPEMPWVEQSTGKLIHRRITQYLSKTNVQLGASYVDPFYNVFTMVKETMKT